MSLYVFLNVLDTSGSQYISVLMGRLEVIHGKLPVLFGNLKG